MGIEKLNLRSLNYNAPDTCESCGEKRMKYNGIGEYQCEKCGFIMYDDYGHVRNYLEKNPGATVGETSQATGVSKGRIRQMLVDDRIQVAPGSVVFLHCAKCGAEIRSGQYCAACDAEMRAAGKTETKSSHIIGGFGKTKGEATGVKRFERH